MFGWLRRLVGERPIDFDPGPMLADGLALEWDIVYRNREGQQSERRITVKSLYGNRYPKYVLAYCHLRREDRHFNLYNCIEARDVNTGDVVPVTNHLLKWLAGRASQMGSVRDRL